MMRISLVIPLSLDSTIDSAGIETFQNVLRDHAGQASVEVVLATTVGNSQARPDGLPAVVVETAEEGRVKLLRAGLNSASGDYLVVLDPERRYPPEALSQLIEGLSSTDADLGIGVPGPSPARTGFLALRRSAIGILGRLALGTSDAFSGLMVLRRNGRDGHQEAVPAYGSRLVFDLLARPGESHVDIPVATRPDDRAHLWPFRFNDLRQLKRVLDRRFGTISRLAQFCMVGASGMAVDLTLYALFQLVWPLAVAGAFSIFFALIWNFTLNRRLTFNDAMRGSIPVQFLTYALGNALGIGVSLFLRLYLPNHVGFFSRHRLAAAVVGIVVATGISFSMSRWVVFIRRPNAIPVPDHPQLKIDTVLP